MWIRWIQIRIRNTERQSTLPEGEEDDGLDGEELDDRVEGSEQVPGGEVEQKQGVQSHRNAAQQSRLQLKTPSHMISVLNPDPH